MEKAERFVKNWIDTYSLPSRLILETYPSTLLSNYESILKSDWFKQLFTRLNELHICQQFLPYIAMDKLVLCKNCNCHGNTNHDHQWFFGLIAAPESQQIMDQF